MNFRWNYQPPAPDLKQEAIELSNAIKKLSGDINLKPVLCQLLIQRGIKTPEEAVQFFNPQLHELLDPYLMNDMDIAVNRLNEAVEKNQRILVYGDYDVDGTTAVALVYNFLKSQGYVNLDYYIPDRYDEGYGVSRKGIDYAHETGASLVIVLDCGIKAVEEIGYARDKGIDFIVCDHHVPDDVLPPAVAILNAKRFDSTYPFKHLSGCGVGFKFMQAFAMSNGIPASALFPLLDLVAVSTASDIVPIMGENRVLTFYGLQRLNSEPCTGLKAIMEVCDLADKRELTINDIIFRIGPRLNASGRLHSGKEAVALMVESDLVEARKIAARINGYNEERKKQDKEMTREANDIVDHYEGLSERRSIVIYDESWNRGVIGIVASRLTEIYYRPAVVLTKTGDMATGSARSVAGFDVYKAVESCKDLLENFGGHTYAVGLSMRTENVDEFKRRFEDYVAANILPGQVEATIDIDAELTFKDIDEAFFRDLNRFQPFGPDNHKPVFCTNKVFDYGGSRVVGREQEHIKLELIDGTKKIQKGIAFGQSRNYPLVNSKKSFDICYTLEENNFSPGHPILQIENIRATRTDSSGH